jgi:hypothetical protein
VHQEEAAFSDLRAFVTLGVLGAFVVKGFSA